MSTQQQQQDSPFPSGVIKPGSQPILLTHQAIVWLVIVSVIVCLTFATVIWLLCRCSCSKRRRQRSRQVLDDRNEFTAWNPNASHRHDEVALGEYPQGPNGTSPVLTPLTRAAAKPAGVQVHPGDPVMVDEAGPEPVYTSSRDRSSRKVGGWSGRFSRFSQIGIAK